MFKNRGKACLSWELASLAYERVEKGSYVNANSVIQK